MSLKDRAVAAAVVGSLVALSIVAGCGGDSTTAPQPINVKLLFDINVDGQPLQLNSMIYTNSTGTKYSIKTLRFVITNVVLHAVDGKQVKIADLHYFTIADASTQTIEVMGGVPHDDWNRLTFTWGLDESRNVRDKYISMTKFQQEMAWPAGLGPTLGYHYMQLEGNYEETPGGSTAGYTTHTGAHQVTGTDPVPLHYYFNVDLPMTSTHVHEGGTGEVTLHIDVNGWYTDHTPTDAFDSQYDWHDLEGTPMGQMIMANPDAQEKLKANGPGCFSASMIAVGGHH